MSESMKCDNCPAEGKRRRRTYAPDGWFYAVSADENGNEYYIIAVCSESCRDAIWKVGPGLFALEDVLYPVTPAPLPSSDPEEMLQALVDTMTSRDVSSMKIDLVSDKWLIFFTSKTDDFCGSGGSIVEAFKDAFSHQDSHNDE